MEYKRGTHGLRKSQASYEFKFLNQSNRKASVVRFPASYFCAPQFYYTDQARFQSNPRQIQIYLAGKVHFPIPMELPRFTEEQHKYSEFLLSTVKVGDIFVGYEEFANLVRQATQQESVGFSGKREFGKPLYHADNQLEPEAALERFDSKFNRTSTLGQLVRAFTADRTGLLHSQSKLAQQK